MVGKANFTGEKALSTSQYMSSRSLRATKELPGLTLDLEQYQMSHSFLLWENKGLKNGMSITAFCNILDVNCARVVVLSDLQCGMGGLRDESMLMDFLLVRLVPSFIYDWKFSSSVDSHESRQPMKRQHSRVAFHRAIQGSHQISTK